MINQQVIKIINEKRIYMLISENPGIPRVNLAARTELSKTTVSALVDELIQEGRIVDEGVVESKRQGRRPGSLAMNDRRDCVIALNWRKRIIQVSLVSAGFEAEILEETAPAEGEDPVARTWSITRDFMDRHYGEQHVLGICLVIPGIIDSEKKRVISMVLPLGVDDQVVIGLREQVKDPPLAIFNDTACLAYAENVFGNMDIKNYVYPNINEGVGASLIQNGNILRGVTGMGAQFGHFSIDRDGEPCSCGNRGCLENRIGKIVLAKHAVECNALEKFEGTGQVLFYHVGQLIQQGKPGVLRLVRALADGLSFGLDNLITTFHPDTIITGGMGRKLGDLYLEQALERVKIAGFHQFAEDADIRFTTLREGVVFRGAAKYFMDTHYDFMEDTKGKLSLYQGGHGIKRIIGVNSNYYHGYSVEDALEGITAAGSHYVELTATKGWTEHVFPSQISEYLDGIREKMKELKLVPFAMSGHCNLMDRERLEDFIRNTRLTVFFGCDYIISSVGEAHLGDREKATLELMAKHIRTLLPYLEECGLTLVLETHGEHAIGTILKEITDRIDSSPVGTNYNTANAIYHEEVKPEEDIDTCMADVKFTHLRDKVGETREWNLPILGKGNADFSQILQKLSLAGNCCPLNIEIEFTPEGTGSLEMVNQAVMESVVYLRHQGFEL